jgi:sec-independent protein translocase protein TatC
MKQQSLLNHLLVLRQCLIRTLIVWALATVVLFYFRETLFIYFTAPLTYWLPIQSQFIATGVITVLTTPLKLALLMGLTGTVPFALYQIWQFVVPGLYPVERFMALRLTLSSVVLFAAGVLFCFWVVLPLIFQFIVQVVPANVLLLPDIQQYVQFCLRLLLAFGLAFQLPLVVWLIAKIGGLSVKRLRQYRPYVIVTAFVVGMVLTPPDVISQILLAVPLWLLFEMSIVLLIWQNKRGSRHDSAGIYDHDA